MAVTAVDELVAFVRQRFDARMAQLDEDERVASAAANHDVIRFADINLDQAGHIRRWLPTRVLEEVRIGRAEVDAKRRILELHANDGGDCAVCSRSEMVEGWGGGEETYGEQRTGEAWPCPTVRLLAQPYAGQPGWREEYAADPNPA